MITILRKEDQADGQFNGGAIMEKRPVVYASEKTFPYSNLFYWAHAWSDKGSTIGLHPHQGFEILSFILRGQIEHYDTKNKTWNPLKAGDVQIIRAGNGISHAEKLHADSAIFQIWFDPNLRKTLSVPATYDDYFADSFPVETKNGIATKVFIGESGPIKMETEGVEVKEFQMKKGEQKWVLSPDKIYSLFLTNGSIALDGSILNKGDFAKVQEAGQLLMQAKEDSTLFSVGTPLRPSYETYIETH